MRQLTNNILRSYRIYTDWCGHGDLDTIIDRHHRRGTNIPEPFIWAVAETLAKCALGMEVGPSDPAAQDSDVEWKQIVHRDLKPSNVFLAAADPAARFPDYPQAKVGDWGLAFRTTPNHRGNPRWHQNLGTDGYKAPEQIPFVDQSILRSLGPKMLSHTNIWGMGIILYSLMIHNDPDQPEYFGDPATETMYINGINALHGTYTPELCEMVLNCLDVDVNVRRTPTQLLNHIQTTLTDPVRGPAIHLGMADGTATNNVKAAQRPLYAFDSYAIGFARNNLPW